MITGYFVAAVISLINVFIGMFPEVDSTVTAYLGSGLSSLRDFSSQASWIIDINQLYLALRVVILFAIAYNTFKGLHWIAKMVSLGLIK